MNETSGLLEDIADVRPRGYSRKKIAFVSAMLACVLVAGGCAALYAMQLGGKSEAPATQAPSSTTPIVKGNLSGSTLKSGTLAFANPRPLGTSLAGTLTDVPSPGTQIGVGGQLYALDNKPVSLLHGTLPAWRAFEPGMDTGPDIKQLEENLASMGYLKATPSTTFNNYTTQAIKLWQKAAGQEETGTLEFGRIVFAPGDLRVGTVKSKVGESITGGTPVLEVTGLKKQVTLNLKLDDQKLAKLNGPVGVELPGGTKTTGKIIVIGSPTEQGTADKKEIVVPVTITLDDDNITGDLQQASVSVSLPSDTRENVLSVPVEALIAISDTQFGVEVVRKNGTTKQVPVTTGLFAAGSVEVIGDGIREGQDVVVPEL